MRKYYKIITHTGVTKEHMEEYELAQLEMAQIYLNVMKNKEYFIDCYKNLVTIKETSSAYFNLGNAFTQINCHKDAEHAFSRAIELDPKNEQLAINIANIYIQSSQYDHAFDIFSKYEKQVPSNLKVKINLSHLHSVLGQNDQALEVIKRTQHLLPGIENMEPKEKVCIYSKIAEIYYTVKNWKMSATNFEKGLDAQKVDMKMSNEEGLKSNKNKALAAELAFKLSECYDNLCMYESSIESLQMAVSFEPSSQKYSFTLAEKLYKTFQFEKCIEHCEKKCEDNIQTALVVLDSLMALSKFDIALKKSSKICNCDDWKNAKEKHGSMKEFWHLISNHILLLYMQGERFQIQALCDRLNDKTPYEGEFFCKVRYCFLIEFTVIHHEW